MVNRRLDRYLDDEPDEPVAKRVGRAEEYGDPEGDRPVPDDVEPDDDLEEDDDVECVDCGSPNAIANPQEILLDSVPAEPRCRVCLQEVV